MESLAKKLRLQPLDYINRFEMPHKRFLLGIAWWL